MGENTITMKREDLEQVVRSALRLGSQAFGVKHKRLVQGIMEEAEEKAIEGGGVGSFRNPTRRIAILDEIDDIETQMRLGLLNRRDAAFQKFGLDLASPPNCTCTGGCGIDGCPGYGEAEQSADYCEFVSYEEARRRKVVAEMHLAELALYEKAPGLL